MTLSVDKHFSDQITKIETTLERVIGVISSVEKSVVKMEESNVHVHSRVTQIVSDLRAVENELNRLREDLSTRATRASVDEVKTSVTKLETWIARFIGGVIIIGYVISTVLDKVQLSALFR